MSLATLALRVLPLWPARPAALSKPCNVGRPRRPQRQQQSRHSKKDCCTPLAAVSPKCSSRGFPNRRRPRPASRERDDLGSTWQHCSLPCDLEPPDQQPDSVLLDIDDLPNATTAAGLQAATAGWEAQAVQEDSLSEKHESSSSREEVECFTETDSNDDDVCLYASQSDSFAPCAKLLLQAFATMSASAIDPVLRVMHHPHLQSADIPWKTTTGRKQALDSMKVWFWSAAGSCDVVLKCC